MRRTLVGLMFIGACGGSSPGIESTPDDLVSGVVTWVVDGDTIEVATTSEELTVRILGINAPDETECYYEDATAFLIDEIKGDSVGLEEQGIDQFGRTLAHIWHQDDLLALTMVHDGLVIGTTPDSGDPHGTQILETEEEAFEAGRGLWASDACGGDGEVPHIRLDVTFDPPGSDGENLDRETVTLTNNSESSFELSGWVLRDESSRHRFHFRDGTRLSAGESIVIRSTDTGWDPGSSPVWNNDGDMALLLDSAGRVVARQRYP